MATMGNTASVLPPNGVENDPLKPVLASEKSPVPGQDVPPVLAVPQLPVNGRDVAAGGNTMDWEASKPPSQARPPDPVFPKPRPILPAIKTFSAEVAPVTHGLPSSSTPNTESSSQSPALTPRTAKSMRGRGKAMRGRKRKFSSMGDKEEDESEEEYTVDGLKTKSGRKVQKPPSFSPATPTPTRKRGPKPVWENTKNCRLCQRGNSPAGNIIVFCERCNGAYHQKCHVPNVEAASITSPDTEWVCNTCAAIKTEQAPVVTGMTGQGLSEEEKRAYLSSLPQSKLIDLLFFCEKMHPDTPLYNPRTRELVARPKDISSSSPMPVDTPSAPSPAATTPATNGITKAEPLNYEEMIITAIQKLNEPQGSPPKTIYRWLAANYPELQGRDIRADGTVVLNRLLKSGRLQRENHLYRVSTKTAGDPGIVPSPGLEDFPAPGCGIKLPPESEDVEYLVQKNPVGFSHFFPGQIANGTGINGAAAVAAVGA